MGAGIALAVAKAGFEVDLVEVDPAVRDRAQVRLQKDAARLGVSDALQRIAFRGAISELADAELAIEAVPEDLALKRKIFAELERKLGSQTILATNTSSLNVAEIAEAVSDPSRVIGLHFFNPPTVMQLVEVVGTQTSADVVLDVAVEFVKSLGKTPVEVADTPGFVVNRVARPYYLQSLRALQAEVATVEELDALARGVGFRMGAFELMDLIGLDVNFATTQSVYERTRAERLAPIPIQAEMVADGRLGRKSGRGFYTYADGATPPKIDLDPPERPAFNEDETVVVLGYGGLAEYIGELFSQAYQNVEQIPMDEDLDRAPQDTSIIFDIGNGTGERTSTLIALDAAWPAETVILYDAYTTRPSKLAQRVKHPERFVGYGILGSFDTQKIIEVVDAESTGDDALGLAQEIFAALGKRVVLVEDVPGLYLGRTVASIVNEAVYAVQEQVASAGDVDLAMQLGTNYPIGPIAWGREIGGGRITRILMDLANAEGGEFAPARAIWVLDAPEDPNEMQPDAEAGIVTA